MKALALAGPLKLHSAVAGDDINMERTVLAIRCLFIGNLLSSFLMFRLAADKFLTK